MKILDHPTIERFRNALVFFGIFILATLLSQRTAQGEIIFLSAGNLTDALRSVTPVGIAALAMTLVIIAGGIDLSVGSIVALSGVVVARLLAEWHGAANAGLHIAIAISATLLVCTLVGLLNGFLTACLSIQPFVITLASMIGIRGLALWLSNNERIGLGVGQDAPGVFGAALSSKATMIVLFGALSLLFLAILNRTVFGRYLRALGDNASAARHAGLPVRKIQVAVYGLSGFMAGVAGLLIAARTTTGDPNAGIAMELDTIAVVVIGGASLAGGRGGILGTLNGTLIVGMVTNILGLRNVDFNLQLVLKACIIVLAVALQPSKRRE
ncbi:MAG: ABC transporter permease [Verrucomicrobiales bacterium]|nr:ABC transporter permease [Verrucomicrobiales bacterium]